MNERFSALLVDQPGPHVVVDDIELLTLAADDRHHLERVLRLRDGDELTATDGRGAWRACRFGAELLADGPVTQVVRPAEISIGFALVKASKPELVVQKLTELGVDRIQPFRAARSVAQWDDAKARRNQERLQRVSREALMQSKGVWMAVVEPVVDFDELVQRWGADHLARTDFDGPPLRDGPPPEDSMVLVGPEGGWTDDERTSVPRAFSLGDRVLRAETASIALATHLVAIRGS